MFKQYIGISLEVFSINVILSQYWSPIKPLLVYYLGTQAIMVIYDNYVRIV